MKKLICLILLLSFFSIPVSAATVPVPEVGAELLPPDTGSFAEDLFYVLRKALWSIRPDIASAVSACMAVMAVALALSLLSSFSGHGKQTAQLCGAVMIGLVLLQPANTLIHLGADTVQSIAEYGNLLLPVMTAALAAQGGITTSAALHTVTAFAGSLLSTAVSRLLVPMVYGFLILALVSSAVGENMVGRLNSFLRWLMTWGMKTGLYLFTGFISVTGVISGTADQTALKATKLTISGLVPVIGGILSDASESVLVGAGVVKNAAGIYGLLATIAIFIGPFLRIGLQYLLLKLTAGLCGLFADKRLTNLVGDFTSAMGILLAMTGTQCLILLISLVCFLKGVG